DRFEIIDDVDGTNVTTQLIQNQYLQTRTPGIYQVSIRSTDQQGNQTTKHIRIHVVNNTGPSFEIDEIILNLDTVSHMDESELVDWFRTHLNKHGYQATQLQIVYNEYENNHDEEGTYYVYLSYQVGDNDYVSRIQVIVEDESFSILSYAYYLILVPIFGISFYFVKRKFKKR
ncbi:MAG: hypothetical protein IH571_02020, partial [Acholeplasmataceae bacterium]|nr:hypothetical protein [Acholeplasmataceae bacterium]